MMINNLLSSKSKSIMTNMNSFKVVLVISLYVFSRHIPFRVTQQSKTRNYEKEYMFYTTLLRGIFHYFSCKQKATTIFCFNITSIKCLLLHSGAYSKEFSLKKAYLTSSKGDRTFFFFCSFFFKKEKRKKKFSKKKLGQGPETVREPLRSGTLKIVGKTHKRGT